jgi:hypothetical protein
MSKKNEEGAEEDFRGFTETAPDFCAIEKHAETLKVSAPVFAAVRQYKGWAAGKKVEKADFERAVKDFLGASMGGKK